MCVYVCACVCVCVCGKREKKRAMDKEEEGHPVILMSLGRNNRSECACVLDCVRMCAHVCMCVCSVCMFVREEKRSVGLFLLSLSFSSLFSSLLFFDSPLGIRAHTRAHTHTHTQMCTHLTHTHTLLFLHICFR